MVMRFSEPALGPTWREVAPIPALPLTMDSNGRRSFKLGRRVMYRRAEVGKWLQEAL